LIFEDIAKPPDETRHAMVQVSSWNRRKDVITAACWTFLELQRKREHVALHMGSFDSPTCDGSALFLRIEQYRQAKTDIHGTGVAFGTGEKRTCDDCMHDFGQGEKVWIFDGRERGARMRESRGVYIRRRGRRSVYTRAEGGGGHVNG
jgi:hypothetical protein